MFYSGTYHCSGGGGTAFRDITGRSSWTYSHVGPYTNPLVLTKHVSELHVSSFTCHVSFCIISRVPTPQPSPVISNKRENGFGFIYIHRWSSSGSFEQCDASVSFSTCCEQWVSALKAKTSYLMCIPWKADNIILLKWVDVRISGLLF